MKNIIFQTAYYIFSSKINRIAMPLITIALIIRSMSRYYREGFYLEACNRLPLYVALCVIVSFIVEFLFCKLNPNRLQNKTSTIKKTYCQEQLFLLIGWILISLIGIHMPISFDRFVVLNGGSLFLILIVCSVFKCYLNNRRKSI